MVAPRKLGKDKPEDGGEVEAPAAVPRTPSAFEKLGVKPGAVVGLRLTPGKGPTVKASLDRGKKRTNIPAQPRPLLGVTIGPKDSGKTRMPVGLPRPYGGLTVVLAFDGATLPGLNGSVPQSELDHMMIVDLVSPVYECKEDPDCQGFVMGKQNVFVACNHTRELIYTGFDPNRPETAAIVLNETLAWIEKLLADGKVDNLILDHYQWLHEGPAESFIFYFNEKDPMGKVKIDEWGTRTRAARMVLQAAMNVPSHALWITGYDKREAMVQIETREGTKWSRQLKDERWLEPVKRPFHVTLYHQPKEVARADGSGNDTEYNVLVLSAKSEVKDLFPKGDILDLTGKDYSEFWRLRDERNKLNQTGQK